MNFNSTKVNCTTKALIPNIKTCRNHDTLLFFFYYHYYPTAATNNDNDDLLLITIAHNQNKYSVCISPTFVYRTITTNGNKHPQVELVV